AKNSRSTALKHLQRKNRQSTWSSFLKQGTEWAIELNGWPGVSKMLSRWVGGSKERRVICRGRSAMSAHLKHLFRVGLVSLVALLFAVQVNFVLPQHQPRPQIDTSTNVT